MARKAYATTKFACERREKDLLVAGLPEDLQPILQEIFRRADALVHIYRQGPEALAEAVRDFEQFCASQDRCLPWTSPDRTCHMTVKVIGRRDLVLISVKRVLWAAIHVCSAQGPQLGADEDLVHTCGNRGAMNSGHGACLNPAHLKRMSPEERVEATTVRHRLDRYKARLDKIFGRSHA